MGKSDFQLVYGISALLYINFFLLAIKEVFVESRLAVATFIITGLVSFPTFVAMYKRKYENVDEPNAYDKAASIFNVFFAFFLFLTSYYLNEEKPKYRTVFLMYSATYLVVTIFSAFNAWGKTDF